MYDQDIIEKRPSSPVSTSLLGVALLAFAGAIVFQIMHLNRYSEGLNSSPMSSASAFAKKEAVESTNFDSSWKVIGRKLNENNPDDIYASYESSMSSIGEVGDSLDSSILEDESGLQKMLDKLKTEHGVDLTVDSGS